MNDFDPQAPFIAQDGLEYEDLAAKILGNPIDSWRNAEILTRRARRNEESVREWIKAYDGEDYVAGDADPPDRLLRRCARAAAADRAFLQSIIDDSRRSKARHPAGTGGADLCQAPSHPVHAADQPPVSRWLGSPGHRAPP